MRQAKVLYKGIPSGVVSQADDGSFRFCYDPPISLVMAKREEPYTCKALFPVFFHLLPEGNNRVQLCRAFRLDLEDDFGLLLQIAKHDTIGAITIQEIEGNE